jgi:light-harvesting protein B-800-850 alpha chain
VVNPTVGLPLFLGSVTLIALGVHAAVLTHTTWFSGYWQGGAKAKVASTDGATNVASLPANANGAYSVTVTPVPGSAAPASFVITVAPNAAVTSTADASGDAAGQTPAHSASAQ